MSNEREASVDLAERSVLGAIMLAPTVTRDVTRVLTPGEFNGPRHQLIYESVLRLQGEEKPTDVVSVVDDLITQGKLERAGGAEYVHELTSVVPSASSGTYYAGIVAEAATGRALIAVAVRIQDAVVRGEQPGVALAEAIDVLAAIRDRAAIDKPVRSLDEIMSVPASEDTYDWVVPGMLERRDRVIITGGEGGGKSMLVRQIAIMAAAGLQPFTAQRVAPARVLVIDAENTEKQWRREAKGMTLTGQRDGAPDLGSRLGVDFQPKIDVTKARDLGRIHRMIDDWKPDLVTIGPLYRLAPSIKNDEEALPVLHALDTIRERGVAMVIEAHAPHADAKSGQRDLRPIGSSALLRWPEFGIGIAKPPKPGEPFQLIRWRGDRDARPWPFQLLSQRETYQQRWPWEPTADYFHNTRDALPGGSTLI